MTSPALLWTIAAALVVLGLLGTFLPVLPGVTLVFLGLVVAAWADGFAKVGWPTLLVLGALTALSFVVDYAATSLGARRAGASRLAAVGAALGALVGLFFGIPGLVIGPFVGAVAGELLARRNLPQAARAGAGAWIGLVLGGLAKIALAFTMVAIFVAAYFIH